MKCSDGSEIETMAESVAITIVGPQVWDPHVDNVDVEVELDDGRRFCATFFTLENIRRLFAKNKTTGECHSGLYFWATDMIIVEVLTLDTIEKTVKDLLACREFESAFSEITR